MRLFDKRHVRFENRICPLTCINIVIGYWYPPDSVAEWFGTVWLHLQFQVRGSALCFSAHHVCSRARGRFLSPTTLLVSESGPETQVIAMKPFCGGLAEEFDGP